MKPPGFAEGSYPLFLECPQMKLRLKNARRDSILTFRKYCGSGGYGCDDDQRDKQLALGGAA